MCACFRGERNSAQRPVIKQQQGKRKRDHHGFRHQAAGKAADHHMHTVSRMACAHTMHKQATPRTRKTRIKISLRSAIQATDSTCAGCSANRNATMAERPEITGHVQKQKKKQNRIGGVQTHIGHMMAGGIIAIKLQSTMCEIHVSGCQFEQWKVVNAHAMLVHGHPLLHMRVLADIVHYRRR